MRCGGGEEASGGARDLCVQSSPRRLSGCWQCPDHDVYSGVSCSAGHDVGENQIRGRFQPSAHEVPADRVTDGLAHDETEAHCRGVTVLPDVGDGVRFREANTAPYVRPIVRPPRDAIGFREHRPVLRRELLATLGATSGKDRPSGACPHAETEAVSLGALAVVRLESSLAHNQSPCGGLFTGQC